MGVRMTAEAPRMFECHLSQSGGFTHASAGWPVLADLGLANWTKSDGTSLHTFCGTAAFIAPEVANHNGYGTAADWWSLGVLMYSDGVRASDSLMLRALCCCVLCAAA